MKASKRQNILEVEVDRHHSAPVIIGQNGQKICIKNENNLNSD
jgi:hypothetical protein